MRKDKHEDLVPFSINGQMGIDKTTKATTSLRVNRPVYQLDELNTVTAYNYQPKSFKNDCKTKLKSFNALSFLYSILPVLYWLPRYSFRNSIFGDIASGITVAIMNIPQGMAYGLLGNLPPVVGIYMAFFPVLVYFLFGTSRHVSIGTFAIVCLMTGKVVSQYSYEETSYNGTLSRGADIATDPMQFNSIQVATTVTFTVAVIQIIMYIFRLGIVATLLSETLVNAFTCACAFQVVAEQVKDLLGLKLPRLPTTFKLPHTIYTSCAMLPEANVAAVITSVTFIIAMVLNNVLIKPRLAKKTKIPIPIELIAVVVGTILSTFLKMHDKYNVSIVGEIPTGLPQPTIPVFSLIPHIIIDSLVITMVSYSITISMALIFATKGRYELDSNQELLALGCSNIFGSFSSCMPVTASLSRSYIQYSVGGVSQIASIVSCSILLFVLLWIGPLFENLPRCVLASIIVVALEKMLMQFQDFKRYWNLSTWDGTVWIITFLTTAIIRIDIGLGIGMLASIFSIFLQGHRPYTCLLGAVPNTDLYLDINRYKRVEELNDIKIFHYSGSLNFASRTNFKTCLFECLGFKPSDKLSKSYKNKEESGTSSEVEDLLFKCLILDFASLTYIDPSGVDMLRSLIEEYKQLGVEVYITSCSGPVFETLKRCDTYDGKSGKFIIFPTIHDSVLYAQSNTLDSKDS